MGSRRIDDITRHMTNDDKKWLEGLLLRKNESGLRSFLTITPPRQRSAVIAQILAGVMAWHNDAHRQHVLNSLSNELKELARAGNTSKIMVVFDEMSSEEAVKSTSQILMTMLEVTDFCTITETLYV